MLAFPSLPSWLLLAPCPQEVADAPPPAIQEEAWEISIGSYALDPPGEDAYLAPIVTADRGALHLEARYNYEELDAGSVFVGRNFSFGDELSLDLTPIFGVVAGPVTGVAPGLELEVAWKGLALYAETEYVIDLEQRADDFLYTWSELTFAPTDWGRFGLVGQRTRVFDQELEVDRGLLVGVTFGGFWLDLYLFNPDGDEPYAGGSVGVGF